MMSGYDDWRIRNTNHETVKKQQRESMSSLISRIALGVIGVLVVLLKNLPDDFSDLLIDALPVIGLFLAIAFPVIAGVIFLLYAQRKHKRENIYSDDKPKAVRQYERPAKVEKQKTADTSPSRDYSESMDPWDVKDQKPPWEL